MNKFYHSTLLIIIGLLFSACPADTENSSNSNNPGVDVKTGKVTFVNYTSYNVVIHRDTFSGPVLLELSSGSKTIDVRTSDNYGVGTIFSIEYLIQINNSFDTESGEVIASGIDPNIQIKCVIESGKSCTIDIPQPTNIEFRSSFIKILNMYNLPFELRYLGTAFKQTGNGYFSVAPDNTGIYKLEGIPADGRLYQNYEIVSTFASTTIPDFAAKNGFIYSFTYDGTSVHDGSLEKKSEPKIQPLIFK